MAKEVQPLPLGNVLRDLALLGGSEVKVSALLPTPTTAVNTKHAGIDATVWESYEFAREARKVMKMQNGGMVGCQGERIEKVRSKLEELLRVCGDPPKFEYTY